MKFETATYSRSAVNECVNLVKNTTWTVATKKEHFSKCFEIQNVFDFCLEKTRCSLFEADYSCWKQYIRDISSHGASKKELDAHLRACHRFVCEELNLISGMMMSGEVNEIA